MSDPFEEMRDGLRASACSGCGLDEIRFSPGDRRCPKAARFALGVIEEHAPGDKTLFLFLKNRTIVRLPVEGRALLFSYANALVDVRVEECADRRIKSAIEAGVNEIAEEFYPPTTFTSDGIITLFEFAAAAELN